jgi:protoheme IX farnesyltransferase
MLKAYYQLTKPGIVYGNVFTTLCAFLFTSRWMFSWQLFFATMIGVALVIASACVFNNYFDRDIDSKMTRTKSRPLVSGSISPRAALVYGVVLAVIGFVLLYIYVNVLTTLVILAGFVVYVFWYTPLKHHSGLAVYVGAIAGAMPIVAGYTAVTASLDLTALLLFTFLFIWQLPHFFAIAAYRYDEYATAGVPLLVKHPTDKQKKLGRKVFLTSLIVLVFFCVVLAFWPLLP